MQVDIISKYNLVHQRVHKHRTYRVINIKVINCSAEECWTAESASSQADLWCAYRHLNLGIQEKKEGVTKIQLCTIGSCRIHDNVESHATVHLITTRSDYRSDFHF